MSSWKPVLLVLVLACPSVRGQEEEEAAGQAIFDRTVRHHTLLAGKVLEPRVGFRDVLPLGPVGLRQILTLGFGNVDSKYAGQSIYDKDDFRLELWVRQVRGNRFAMNVQALVISGPKAPKLASGLSIGDPESKIAAAHRSKPVPFDASFVGRAQRGQKVRSIDLEAEKIIEMEIKDPEDWKDARYYAEDRVAYRIEGGRIAAIAVFGEDREIPEWLLDRAADSESFDTSISVPTLKKSGPAFPAPPELEMTVATGLRLPAPRSWQRRGDTWTDPSGKERLSVRLDHEATPRLELERLAREYGKNEVEDAWVSLDEAFARDARADEVRLYRGSKAGAGREGFPVAVFALILRKGDDVMTIELTRTRAPEQIGWEAVGDVGTPDGEAMARAIFRAARCTR